MDASQTKAFKISIITLMFTIIIQIIYLARYNWNIGAFMAVPDYLAQQINGIPYWVPTYKNSGHDGILIWAVAKSIFHPNLNEVGHHYERVMMPLIVWITSLGNSEAMFYVTPILNALATAAIAYFSVLLFLIHGQSPYWAILCALNPGAFLPLRFNVANQIVTLFITMSFTYFYQRKIVGQILALAAAFLGGTYSAGVILVTFLKSFYRRNLVYISLAVIPYLLYKFWLVYGLELQINVGANDALSNGNA